jgi:Flp pilus assembly secretin CpaC
MHSVALWVRLARAACCIGLAGAALEVAPAAAVETIPVRLDHAQVLKLPPKTTTVVIGNPMIADVTVQKNGSMIVTGKSYGTTNLIAQDASGAVLGESFLRVEAPNDDVIVVQRGMDRESYSCTPRCQPALSLGDAHDYFNGVTGQAVSRSQVAAPKQ